MISKKSKLKFISIAVACVLVLSMLLFAACGDKTNNNGPMSVAGHTFKFECVDILQMCSNDRRLEFWQQMGYQDESEFNGFVVAANEKNANSVIEFKEDGTYAYFIFDDANPEKSRVELGTYKQDKYVINCYSHETSQAPDFVFNVWHEIGVGLVLNEFFNEDGTVSQYVIVLYFEEVVS